MTYKIEKMNGGWWAVMQDLIIVETFITRDAAWRRCCQLNGIDLD